MKSHTIEHYLTEPEQEAPYLQWLEHLRDRRAKVAIIRRTNRVEHGNFSDHKFCGDGVWELRIDVGPGYRVYYGQSGPCIVLLLCGGDKRMQHADIIKAVSYWQDWKRRNEDEKQRT